MEFGFKTARTDEWTSNAVVGTSDLGLTFEGPTGENSSLILSARRSYLQFLFEVLGLPFLPIYNDFQFKWVHQASPNERLTVLGIGAYDDFQLNLAAAEDTSAEDYLDQVAILDALQVNRQWNYALGVKYDRFTENGRWTWVASRNMLSNRAYKHEDNDESLPLTLDYLSQEMENKLRLERRTYGDSGFKMTWGAEYEFARFNNDRQPAVPLPSGYPRHGQFQQRLRPAQVRRLPAGVETVRRGTRHAQRWLAPRWQ